MGQLTWVVNSWILIADWIEDERSRIDGSIALFLDKIIDSNYRKFDSLRLDPLKALK